MKHSIKHRLSKLRQKTEIKRGGVIFLTHLGDGSYEVQIQDHSKKPMQTTVEKYSDEAQAKRVVSNLEEHGDFVIFVDDLAHWD